MIGFSIKESTRYKDGGLPSKQTKPFPQYLEQVSQGGASITELMNKQGLQEMFDVVKRVAETGQAFEKEEKHNTHVHHKNTGVRHKRATPSTIGTTVGSALTAIKALGAQ